MADIYQFTCLHKIDFNMVEWRLIENDEFKRQKTIDKFKEWHLMNDGRVMSNTEGKVYQAPVFVIRN